MATSLADFRAEWLGDRPYIEAHTSGSTGKPKTIRLPKELMRESAWRTIKYFSLGFDSLLCCPLSLDYIAGKMMAVRAWEAGCGLDILAPSLNPFAGYKPDRPISLLAIVPSMIEALAAWPARDMVDNIIIGGAPLSAADEALALTLPGHAFATYGMTETASHIALRPLGQSLYELLPGIEADTDERGCLRLPGMATNDRVEFIAPRLFRWLGRADFTINSGGMKLQPEEMEAAVAPLLPSGIEFYVTSRPSERWGEEAVAVCSSAEMLPLLEEAFEKAIADKKRRPKAYILRPVKRSANGKLLREKLG